MRRQIVPQWTWVALKEGLLQAMSFRIEFLSRVFGEALSNFGVQWVLWFALFKVGGNESFAGQTYSQMMAYSSASILFSQIRVSDTDYEISDMIRTGKLNQYLIRPIHPIGYVYFGHLGSKLFFILISTLLGFIGLKVLDLPFINLFYSIALAFLGQVILFLLSASLATVGFYWEEAFALIMMKNLIVQILCGEIIPLFVFPESTQRALHFLPFHLLVFTPTQIFLGRFSNSMIAEAFTISIVWIVLSAILLKVCWNKGIRNYLAIGG